MANKNTLLPTQMSPSLPARATFVADTNFVSGTQKMFLILFRNILCPQQMFPRLGSPRNIMGNNVSTTISPRLPETLQKAFVFSAAKNYNELTYMNFMPQVLCHSRGYFKYANLVHLALKYDMQRKTTNFYMLSVFPRTSTHGEYVKRR